MLAVFFFVNSTYFTTFEGRHCIRALLAKENQRGEKGARGTGQPWWRCAAPSTVPREGHCWPISSRDTFKVESGLFQQPSLLKESPHPPLRPSPSISFVIPLKETTTFHSWFCIVSKLQNLVIIISYHLDQLLLHFPTSSPSTTNITLLIQLSFFS